MLAEVVGAAAQADVIVSYLPRYSSIRRRVPQIRRLGDWCGVRVQWTLPAGPCGLQKGPLKVKTF